MKQTDELQQTMREVAAALDSDPEAAVLFTQIKRDLRLAASDDIDVTSWDDFNDFFQKRRGQELVFRFTDQYGAQDPKTKAIASLVQRYDALDKELHQLYTQLKGEIPAPDGGDAPATAENALGSLEGT